VLRHLKRKGWLIRETSMAAPAQSEGAILIGDRAEDVHPPRATVWAQWPSRGGTAIVRNWKRLSQIASWSRATNS